MNNLIAFLSRYNHWLLFLLLEVVSGVLLFRYNSYQGSVWVSSANTVTGKVHEWQSSVEQFFSLQERAAALTRRNTILEYQLWRARQELLDLRQDTTVVDSMLKAVTDELHLMPAKVVSNTVKSPDNLITIDKGADDGVTSDMGVISGTGIVGVVFLAGKHYSVVLPVLNAKSRVSCAIRNKGYFGYLMWDGKDPKVAYMEDIPRHAQFEKGDWVETSGYSDIFPPGLTVGQITDIGNSADGLSYRLKVDLSTDFACLRDVSVITDECFSEKLMLIATARDSIAQ